MSFPRYPKYKENGVEWLGQVPEHWSLIRFKNVFAEKDSVVGSTYPAGSISYGRVVFKDDEFLHEPTKASYQEVKAGEFLINPINLNYDLKSLRTALSDINTRVSPAYIVLKAKAESDLNYLKHQLHVFDLYHMKTLGAGVRQTITFGDIGGCFTVLPPLPEQTAIADFLDRETAKIDGLIAEQERLIELLREKRQAVISHAVTKGLNPDAPMKDSGIEWLGQVPEHWICLQLGKVCKSVADGPHYSPDYVDEGVPFLSARNVKVDCWSLDDAKYISEADCDDFDRRVIPQINDVLYTKGGTTGIARVVDLEFRFQVWVHLAVLKIHKEKVDPYFLAYALNGIGSYEQAQLLTRGATNNDLGLTRMIKIWFALPTIAEQREIVESLDNHIAQLDALTVQVQRAITLLQERRSALISAAVTGQIDVRSIHHQEAA